MLEKIEARITALAQRAKVRAGDRVAGRLSAELPELHVSRTEEGVAIEGRGLWRDARLRWIGSLLR